MTIQFTDGVKINTSGPYRTLHLKDGWYIVGQGQLIPMADAEECRNFLDLRNKNLLTWAGK